VIESTEDGPGGEGGLLDRLLRIPLYHKLVGANALLILATLAGALWIRNADLSHLEGGPLLLGGIVVGVGVALNLALLRTALGPVKEIEDTARRVERGEFDARAEPSRLTDRDLRRVTDVFNRMLDVVADHRRRQRALTLRTFEREERDHAETARKLRESTAQRVAALLMQLRAARGELGESPILDECQQLARDTLEDLRRTARDLRRPEIDDLGLDRALRAYATDLAGPGGPRVELEGGSLRRCLERETRFRLYRILQEAVANAVEHAEAETVTLSIGVEDGVAYGEVRDDGVGFRTYPDLPEASRRPGGTLAVPAQLDEDGTGPDDLESLGLVAMRERARDLGAELTLDSGPGRGTTVRVEVLCDAEDVAGSGGPAAREGARHPMGSDGP